MQKHSLTFTNKSNKCTKKWQKQDKYKTPSTQSGRHSADANENYFVFANIIYM